MMIRDVILPQLAMGMSEGTIVEWMVKEGARVARDQPLVAIETEKVVTDLPAPYAGFVHLLAPSDKTFPVETLIAKIADSEEEYRSLINGPGTVSSDVAEMRQRTAVHAYDGLTTDSRIGYGDNEKPQETVLASSLPIAAAGATTVGTPQKIRASGLAKAIARKNEIDLSRVPGSGPGGRIIRRDVITAIEQSKVQKPALPGGMVVTSGAMRERARVPVTGMRATIAQRMLAAKTTAAQTYAFFEVDITKLLAVRKTFLGYEDELAARVSLITFYARATALACQYVPICNSTLTNGEISVWENVNVGIAVALPGRSDYESGLIVPVIRDVQSKGLLQIDTELKDMVKRARASELSPMETADGTITISSTDGFLPGGWFVSTPLLNLPQVINFQPGTPVEKPVVVDGQIAIRTILPCGVTFDHRAMDGEPLGRFVKKLRDLLANPELMLL